MMNLRFAVVCAAGIFAAAVAQAGKTVCFEAETATKLTPPLRLVEPGTPAASDKMPLIKGAAGNRYLEIPEGVGKPPETGGDAELSFDISEAGTYFLWCRVWWMDSCGNSLGISLDGATAFTFGQDATYKTWHWVRAPLKLKQLELSVGRHTLKISNREDGIAVDQFLFTQERRYVPVGIESVTVQPATTPAPAAGK